MLSTILIIILILILVGALLSASFAGCTVIGDIFKAGVWIGVIIVVFLMVAVFGLVRLFKG